MTNRFQEENTREFLDEYLLDLSLDEELNGISGPALPESTLEEDERMRKMAAELVTPFDTNLRSGEIRMLSQPDKLVFGVVLPWDWSRVLLVPFSGMKHPATDLEMYAEDGETRSEGMQVYQIWNARTVYKSVIRKSWLCGSVSVAELGRLNRMLRYHLLGEQPLDESLRPLIGAPLTEGNDIRRVYMEKEKACFAPLDRENMEMGFFFSQPKVYSPQPDKQKKLSRSIRVARKKRPAAVPDVFGRLARLFDAFAADRSDMTRGAAAFAVAAHPGWLDSLFSSLPAVGLVAFCSSSPNKKKDSEVRERILEALKHLCHSLAEAPDLVRFIKDNHPDLARFVGSGESDQELERLVSEKTEDAIVLLEKLSCLEKEYKWMKEEHLRASRDYADNTLSSCIVVSGDDQSLIPDGIPVKDFRPIAAGSRIPNLTWHLNALPDGCKTGMTVFFYYATELAETPENKPADDENLLLIGSGIVEKGEENGFDVMIKDVIPPENTPEIRNPADIVLVFNKE